MSRKPRVNRAEPVAIAHMIGTIIGLVLLMALLGVMFYCARMLLPLIPLADWFRTILRVLIILLVTIVALYAIVVLYVIVVLLGFVGICCAAIWKQPRDPGR